MLPVTEFTPQFKDFYVKNIVCYGAEKGIFIRGLPEMNIKNIKLENLVLQSRIGVQCEEATNVSIKNLKIITTETNPLINILNSNNILFDKLSFNNADLLVNVVGDRNSKIKLTNVDTSKAKNKITASFGANENIVEFN
jgi:hypothetical protein